MTTTYGDQLASVQAAIAKVEANGQAYEIGNDGAQRRVTRADLATLYTRETYLRGMAARESRGRAGIGTNRLVAR